MLLAHRSGDHGDHGEQHGVRRVEQPAKEHTRAAPHATRTLSSGASGVAAAAAVKKVGIRPDRWHEASRPLQTAAFSTAEESSAAKDERFRSRPSIPRIDGSQRARRGKEAGKRAGMPRSSGAERRGGGRIPYHTHVKQVYVADKDVSHRWSSHITHQDSGAWCARR